MYHHVPTAVVVAVLDAWPDAAKQKNSTGNTPLHRGLMGGVAEESLLAVLNAWCVTLAVVRACGCVVVLHM
jgi:hypothetical protein